MVNLGFGVLGSGCHPSLGRHSNELIFSVVWRGDRVLDAVSPRVNDTPRSNVQEHLAKFTKNELKIPFSEP